MSKKRTKKSILGCLLIMALVLMQLPIQVHAATYKEVPIRNQDGYDFSLIKRQFDNQGNIIWEGLEIGEYCHVKVGQRIAPSYGQWGHINMRYYTTPSGIILDEKMESLPNAGLKARTMLPKKPTDLHMAYYTDMEWCIERAEITTQSMYIPYISDYSDAKIYHHNVYPKVNYYGVNYELDGGSWSEKTDWIETKDSTDYGIWKPTQEQYDEAGNLYEDNIWFAYEGFEVVLPGKEAVTKAGYELNGWEITGSAIVAPGGKYTVSYANGEKIDIKASWVPKRIDTQVVNQITREGATFTADYESHYDLTDKGFMYKESSANDWIDVKAEAQDGKLTATVTGLKAGTSYDVKGYFESQTGRIENEEVLFSTEQVSSSSRNSRSSSTSVSANITVKTPSETTENPNPSTQATTTVTPTVTNGTTNVTVSQSIVSGAISKAQEEAKKKGTEKNGITVEIKADAKNITVNNLSANLPKSSVEALVKAEVNQVRINSGVAVINLDLKTLNTIQKELGSDVNVSAKKVDNSTLSTEAKAVVGNRPVFDFTVTGANGTKVTEFGKGKVTVSIPYTLGENEKAENVVVYYIDNEGKVKEMPNCIYDEKNKIVSFVTNHFSNYAVGYKADETTTINKASFTDVANHWAKEEIRFVTERGLFGGTAQGKFSPNMSMTRGMFVTVLGRLAKADVSIYTNSSFTDVKTNAYYLPYIQWAGEKGIVNGVSKAGFAPNQSITREQMAVIMASYAKAIGFELQQVNKENNFVDNAEISSYAKEAVKQMQMAGVLAGKDGNRFDPKGTATRAEVSAVIKRFAELVEKK